MLGAGKRIHKIVVQRKSVTTDEYGGEIETWTTWTTDLAEIFYGSGREQREAAQKSAVQAASFEVLSHSKSRAIIVIDRLCYPVTAADPADWPVWDIQAVIPLGLNKGVRINATRPAA